MANREARRRVIREASEKVRTGSLWLRRAVDGPTVKTQPVEQGERKKPKWWDEVDLEPSLAVAHKQIEELRMCLKQAEERNASLSKTVDEYWKARLTFANQQIEELTRELEGQWLRNHADTCDITHDCTSFGGSKRCHYPRPPALTPPDKKS